MPDSRVEILPKQKAGVYLHRAENLIATMEAAAMAKNPDGVAVTAVQATVALADAYTILTLQRRNRTPDHREVVSLIASARSEHSAAIAGIVQRVLDRKSEVEYGNRAVRLNDAEDLAKSVRKLARMVARSFE
jgi:hypothetical protein